MENQPETKPDYFIQIPSRVLFETKLSAAAKLFYGEVLLLSHTNGFCSNDNHYFIKNHDVTDKTIQNWINELKSLKLIKIEYIRNHSYKVDIRKIFPLVKIDSTIISHKGPNDTLIFRFEPKPKSNPINKQVFGEHQNIFLLEKEITELKRKYSDEIIEQAFQKYGDWKYETNAKPRSDFNSMKWAFESTNYTAYSKEKRKTAVQSSGCDEVSEETLENLPF